MRRAWRRGTAALGEWTAPEANPFLARALRLEGRKHRPLLTLLGVALATALLNGGAWWLWTKTQQEPPAWRRLPVDHLPLWAGSNAVGLVALLTAFGGACGALWASRARAAYLLREELLKSTLDQLQLLPIAEERWLWLMSAHPVALSLLIGLCGLPVYALAVFTGQWTPLDVIGLALVFLLIGHAAPQWTPAQWQQRGRQGFDFKQWQETVRQAQRDNATQRAAGGQTPGGQLEAQRRMQRAMSGLDAVSAPQGGAQPGAQSGGLLAGWGRQAGGPVAGLMGWFQLWVFINVMMAVSRAGGTPGGLRGAFNSLRESLPPGVTDLLPAIVLTWPLVLARLMFAPLPFFAFTMPLVVFGLPLAVCFHRLGYAKLAANVSTAETFWTPRRLRRHHALNRAVGLLIGTAVCGYGWRYAIGDGALAILLPGANFDSDWAIAAAWTIAVVLGTLAAGGALEAPLKRARQDEIQDKIGPGGATREAARAVARAAGWTLAFYFGACWLGGASGTSDAWALRLGPTLGTGAAFVLADFGASLLETVLPAPWRERWKLTRWLWFFGLGLMALALGARGVFTDRPFAFEQAPFVVLSPFVSLLALFRYELSPLGVPWWSGPAVQAVVGVACLALSAALLLRPRLSAGVVPPEEEPDAAPGGLMAQIIALLRRMGAAIARGWQALKAMEERANAALVRNCDGLQNPVLTEELRRRLRHEHWLWQGVALLLAELWIVLYVVEPWSFMPGPEFLLVTLALTWAAAFFTVLRLGQAFDRDRANGTLVFLFLTPLTDRDILLGKLLPGLLYSLVWMITALPWLGLGVAFFATNVGLSLALMVAGCGFMVALAALLCFAELQLLFAVRAVKPTEGSSKAIAWGSVVAACSWFGVVIAGTEGWGWLCFALLIATPLHLALAFLCWRLALWSMRRKRYGDVAGVGKAAG